MVGVHIDKAELEQVLQGAALTDAFAEQLKKYVWMIGKAWSRDGFRLKPPLSLIEVTRWEETHWVTLPADFRWYITKVSSSIIPHTYARLYSLKENEGFRLHFPETNNAQYSYPYDCLYHITDDEDGMGFCLGVRDFDYGQVYVCDEDAFDDLDTNDDPLESWSEEKFLAYIKNDLLTKPPFMEGADPYVYPNFMEFLKAGLRGLAE